MPNVDIKFIESLQKDIKEIIDDISDLMWDRKMYTDLVEMVNNNKEINTANVFYDFVKTGYVSHVVLGICRQIDRDEKALSLMNFLTKIFSNAEKITRDWYSAQYKNTNLNEEFGKIHFKEHFGGIDFIDPSIVYADIGSLIFYTKEIKKYRNKRIAHKEKGIVVFDKDFNFETFNKAIDTIEELGKKYYLLMHQAGYEGLEPTDLTNYIEIFYKPWIIKEPII